MKTTTLSPLAALIALMFTFSPARAQELGDPPGVFLIVPPQFTKYTAKMPTHFQAIRADQEGKQTSSKTIIGSKLPDARTAGKGKFFFQLTGTQVLPGKMPGNYVHVKTSYKLFYRTAKGYQEITKGEFSSTAFASPFIDTYGEHFAKLGAGLSADVSHALASKVLEEKEIKVPSPPHRRQSPGAEPENPRERVAFKVERKTVDKDVFFTFFIHNRLPAQVRVRELEIVNTVTGECHRCVPNADGEPWVFEPNQRVTVGAKMPLNQAPLEAQAVRIRDLFLVLPE